MKEMKRFFSYMGNHKFAYWSILIITLLVETALQILYSVVTKQTLNAIEFQDVKQFEIAVVVCVGIILCKCLFPYLRYFQIKLVRKMVYEMKLKLFEKLLKMDMRYYGDTHSANALKTLNWDANSLKDSWFSHVYWVLGKIVLVTASIITMCVYSPILTSISLLVSVLTAWISIKVNKAIKNSAKKVQKKSARLASLFSDILVGFVTLKMNAGMEIVIKHFETENNQATSQEKSRVHQAAMLEMIAFLLGIIGSFGTIVVGVMLAAKGKIDLGTVMAVVTLQMSISVSMQRFGSSISAFSTSVVRANTVFDFLEQKNEECIEWRPDLQQGWNCYDKTPETNAIEISNVHFSYHQSEQAQGGKAGNLNCDKMIVHQNEKIMLIGESGCGKSTLLKLLQGFYKIQEGEITILGKNIRSYPLEELRNLITYVPQNSYLFEGTIAENISLGCGKDGEIEESKIVHSAKLANADEFICQLPEGYHTHLEAGGGNLSGGQRQRIAIARALLKDAPIVLLDEPSSALDAHSEKLVLQSMGNLMKDKTVIMVSHRLLEKERFDRVITLV